MKEVLITGGGSGIGAATARLFSARGWKVHLLGRTAGKLTAVQKELKNPGQNIVCDLDKNLNSIASQIANLDISVLVNNAGVIKRSPLMKTADDDWLWHFNTNLFAPVKLTRLLWSQIAKNKGCVTNVSSSLGLRPIAGTGAYSASKAALNSWSQTLALEGAPQGVRVNAICPGLVDTPIHSYHGSDRPEDVELKTRLQKLQPLGRTGQPDDIAKAIYFVSSEDASWMTGTLVPVDGGVMLTTFEP